MRTIIRNAAVFQPDRTWQNRSVYIENGTIRSEFPENEANHIIDGDSLYLIPGLIDLHLHGCMGRDASDAADDALRTITKHELSIGVTSIALSTMTLPAEELKRILSAIAEYAEKQDSFSEAAISGINMEGPFISHVRKGAQNEDYILPCNAALCQEFLAAGKGLVKFLGIAPEASIGSIEFIAAMKDHVRLSLAHTDADYEKAREAIEAGVTHATHLFNAMPELGHRNPGAVGAVLESDEVDAEIICDGIHIHPAIIRAAHRLLGSDRMIMISDSIRAAGMPDGIYELGGQSVELKEGRARLASGGAIAGSAATLPDCLRYAVKEARIPLENAIYSSTFTPAKSLGIDGHVGTITEGKQADLILMRPDDLGFELIMKRGRIL